MSHLVKAFASGSFLILANQAYAAQAFLGSNLVKAVI